ncbi:MAG TPA: AbrB/MazE/SpoVT family DNA-binding domain-containing protein [Terriglobia bacterium]|jgi:bifunctional DNA-binding transcriptional regulator/antitoxin component of YhaV-PrlF toxin-antitoxin module|nr:AbrB/MazE/SpoVT family DNA-binding domain-containing protein [Terriglobia bacterium]
MSKVTSKLQLTVPKAIADQYGIRPGDELQWAPAGDAIRVISRKAGVGREGTRSVEERLQLFREMIERQRRREANVKRRKGATAERPSRARAPKPHEIERGWTREELYTRGRTR